MHLLFLLQLIPQVQPKSIRRTIERNRRLGRWSFDEPCIAGPIFYENPDEGNTQYDEELRRFTRTDGRIYEDVDFTIETTVHTDTICGIFDVGHITCDYYLVDDDVGVFSLFSGLAELEFSHNGTTYFAVGKGRYVFQGGSDLHGGIIGKVNTIYETDVITHDFCVQGSTYDHLVPPLPSVSNSSTSENASNPPDEDTINDSNNASKVKSFTALVAVSMVWFAKP